MKPGWLGVMCLLLLPAVGHTSDVYRWQDEEGRVHFSDRALAEDAEPVTPSASVNRLPAFSTTTARSRGAAGAVTEQPASNRERLSRQSRAALERQRRSCDDYQRRLDRIQSQLRAGYSNTRGNRLRAQRRDLAERYHRECRNL